MKGERLAEVRKDRGLKQRDLSKILSVSEATISGYENNRNRPGDEIKVNIAKTFDISLDYLLGAVDDELKLNRENVIVLPKDFPEDARAKVLEYVELIMFKYTHGRGYE